MSVFFSIIIPTYKQPQYIYDCIKSFLNQTFSDFELIISDDSEDNETAEIVNSIHDKRIRYYRNSRRLGRVYNYRVCVRERASGKWCLICDGDDYLTDQNYLKTIRILIENYPSVVFFQAGHLKGANEEVAKTEMPNIQGPLELYNGFEYLMNFQQIAHFSHLTTVSRLSLLNKIDPFRLSVLSADMETYLRLAAHGDVCLLAVAAGLWRQHDHNASSSSGSKILLQNLSWISSVTQYWLFFCPGGSRTQLKSWRTSYRQSAYDSLFRSKLREPGLTCFSIASFIYSTFRYGYARCLFRSATFSAIVTRFFTPSTKQ